MVDFLLNCMAILFAITAYSDDPKLLNGLLFIPAIVSFALFSGNCPSLGMPKKKTRSPSPEGEALDLLPQKPFVTAYRGTMLVVTVAAILAVDFPVFPRRFAKVENWGTSLMDIGVGSFVFSAGTVAARPVLKEKLSNTSRSLAWRLYQAARHSSPLLVLGFIRLYSVKGLDYAEHVSEYGVHWNFFFTLALLAPFMAVFDAVFRFVPSYAVLGVIISVAYQITLESTSLQDYILIAPRVDLLSKNREGLFSFFGYLAIFLIGQDTGMVMLPRAPHVNSLFDDAVVRRLALNSAIWIGLFFLCTDYKYGAGLEVSRRLANLAYVLWIAAFNCVQITLFCIVENLEKPKKASWSKGEETRRYEHQSSRLLRALNRNGLAVFLLANLLTGLVNLTLPTLTMSDIEAMAVLVAYMATISIVAFLLDYLDISIKL